MVSTRDWAAALVEEPISRSAAAVPLMRARVYGSRAREAMILHRRDKVSPQTTLHNIEMGYPP